MRNVLLKRIRPLVERFAADVAHLTADRIERELARLPEAFEIALSAFADNAPRDILVEFAPELAALIPPQAPGKPDKKPTVARAKTATPKPPPPERVGKVVRSKCGYVGGNARGCGRTHNVRPELAPAADSDEDEGAVPGNLQSARSPSTKLIEWDETRRLIALVQQHDDKRALDRLVRGNIGLVHRLAHKAPWHAMPYDDVIQEGVIGLMQGIRKFDLASPYRLSTYASHLIWHCIVRSHENGAMIRLPARHGMSLVKISRAQFKLEAKLGRAATDEEIAAASEVSVADVRRLQQRGQVTTSLDLANEDDQSWMHERLASDAASPEEELARSDVAAELLDNIKELPRYQAKVLKLRYLGEGMTLEQAGAVIETRRGGGLSRERIRQIERDALETLRKRLRDAGEAA